jgi:hypothetical protein
MQARQASRFFHEEPDSVLHQTLSNEPQETVEFVGGVFHRLQGTERCMGQTPLMLAAKSGRAEAVMLLIQSDANPRAKDEDGMEPLHFAAASGCRDCCKALLRARASPTELDSAGRDAFAILPRLCTADELDRVQWAALFGVPLDNRSFSTDFLSNHFMPDVSHDWVSATNPAPPFVLSSARCQKRSPLPFETRADGLSIEVPAVEHSAGILDRRPSEGHDGQEQDIPAPEPGSVPMPGLFHALAEERTGDVPAVPRMLPQCIIPEAKAELLSMQLIT